MKVLVESHKLCFFLEVWEVTKLCQREIFETKPLFCHVSTKDPDISEIDSGRFVLVSIRSIPGVSETLDIIPARELGSVNAAPKGGETNA
uniref:Uncharacterized protein n=1 Tax=viral metagenome TaxID=1070528 RepID=A0A6H2A0C9_9ZZZZ